METLRGATTVTVGDGNNNNNNKATAGVVPVVDDWFIKLVLAHRAALDAAIKHDRDYQYSFFGFKVC